MNLPNKLTISRIVIVVAMVILYSFLSMKEAWVTWTLLILFVVGSFTDFLDGYLARTYHLVSDFGKLMDPIADKMLVNTTLFILCLEGKAAFLCFILMLWRDLVVDGLRMVSSSKGLVIAASPWGKLKTTVQMVAIIFIFVDLPFANGLLWIATAISLASGLDYVIKGKECFRIS